MNQHSLHYYDFGPFRLNATERFLQCGSEVVPLTPKVFDTLLVLVENNGHIVEKTELMQTLWPDSFVEESSLTQNISLLRRALSEHGGENNYIQTIPKRGYRFVADVRESYEPISGNAASETVSPATLKLEEQTIPSPVFAATEQPQKTRRSTRQIVIVCGLIGFAVLISSGYWFRYKNKSERFVPRSLAVLPFKVIGKDAEKDLLGLGMADALIIKLSRLDQLTVLPTSSIFGYTQRDKEVVAIGRDLGVEGILDGTVQRDGDWVRVTAQLIRLSDGKTVWSGKFDERYSSIFALQDSISAQLASSLRPHTEKTPTAAHLTENTKAYEAYLTGLYFWNRRTKENIPKAIQYLEETVALDPEFALAHAMLADSYYLSMSAEYGGYEPVEATRRANNAVTKALELNDQLAEAYVTRAGLKLRQNQADEAGRDFRRSLELQPNYATAHLRYAYYLIRNLKIDEALSHMRRAQQLDPVSAITNGALAGVLYRTRDYDGCIHYAKRALELEPAAFGARLNMGEAYVQKRMFREAHEAFDKVSETHPTYIHWEKAFAYALSGNREAALSMIAQAEKANKTGQRSHFHYALVYGALGDKDEAFAELNQVGHYPQAAAALKFDPQLDPLRDDPRFKDVLNRHGLE
jgi:DNA-binding winged helix-turn-helix (wHTH) protein/TolB-like protein/Tfp pilus assembly protein PilF